MMDLNMFQKAAGIRTNIGELGRQIETLEDLQKRATTGDELTAIVGFRGEHGFDIEMSNSKILSVITSKLQEKKRLKNELELEFERL